MVSAAAAAASPSRGARPGDGRCGARRPARRNGGRAGGRRAGAAGLGGLRRRERRPPAPRRSLARSHTPGPLRPWRPRGAGRGLAAAAGERLQGEFSRRGSPGIPFARLKGSTPWLPLLSLAVATAWRVSAERGGGAGAESDSAAGEVRAERAHPRQRPGLRGTAGDPLAGPAQPTAPRPGPGLRGWEGEALSKPWRSEGALPAAAGGRRARGGFYEFTKGPRVGDSMC